MIYWKLRSTHLVSLFSKHLFSELNPKSLLFLWVFQWSNLVTWVNVSHYIHGDVADIGMLIYASRKAKSI